MKTIRLEVITPERVILETEAQSLTMPGAQGRLGVLPGHIPMVVQLVPGELIYYQQGASQALVLGSGYGEIRRDRVRLFVEEATLAAEIDLIRTQQEAEQAGREIKARQREHTDLTTAEAALKVALAKMKVARTRRGKR